MTKLYRLFLLFSCLSLGAASISCAQSISNVNPASGNLGQTLSVSISGQSTSFGQGTSTTNVWFSQGSSTLVYPNSVTITNSGLLIAGFIFPNTIPSGSYDVNVLNSIDGQMIVPIGFLLNPNPNPPVIVSVAPSSAITGQTLTVTVTGQYTNFSQGTSTANVWFNQGTSTLIYPNNVTVLSDTAISANFTIPTNAISGSYDVSTSDDIDGQLVLSGGFFINSCNLSANYSSNNVCLNNPTTFSDLSTTQTGVITSWVWNFGDGNTSTLQNPQHTYPGYGSYTVALLVTNNFGCKDSIRDSIFVNPLPIPNFVSDTVCFNNQTSFSDLSFVPYGSITGWSWNFGDPSSSANISNIQNPSHAFTSPGSYTVIMTITSDSGCQSTTAVSAIVYGSSVSLIMTKDSANPLLWYLQPTITGTAPFTYLWNFGDGNTSTLPTPTHNYAVAGHYAISLTITDANGCSSSTTDSTYRITTSGLIQNLIVLNSLTGIQENSISVNAIFPNPANSNITVSLSQSLKGDFSITDITGREVYKEKVNSDNIQVNVANLPVGYYTLSIVSGTKMVHSKIMIVR
jgi:PKD repeat protein